MPGKQLTVLPRSAESCGANSEGAPIAEMTALERCRVRLGPVDELNIRLLLRVSPAQRLRTMLDLQDILLDGLRSRLRKAHPDLSDYQIGLLMFQRLKQNG